MRYTVYFFFLVILILGCRSNSDQDEKKATIKLNSIPSVNYDTIITVQDSSKKSFLASLPALKHHALFDGKVEIDLPGYFDEMSSDIMRKKYPSANRPSIIYTNQEGTINFTFKHTEEPCFPNALPQYMEKAVAQFSRISPEELRSGIQRINGTDFIVIEFVSKAIDTKIYNLMYFTSLNAKIFMGTFNCIIKERATWEPIAKHIIQSIKISK